MIPLRAVMYPVDERCGQAELPLLSVSQYRGVQRRDEATDGLARVEDLSNYKVVHPGELVINRMSAYQGALGVAAEVGVVSPDYLVLRFRSGHEPRYWQYCLKSPALVSEMASRVRGIGSIDSGTVRTPRIGYAELKQIEAASFGAEEQVAIADFLDRETAKIDALIDKQLAFIGGLGERRERLHSSIVDRQSDWPRVALRHLTSLIVDCPHWTPEVVGDSEYEAVRSGCIRDGEYRPAAALKVSREVFDARNRGISLDAGDVLFAREAPAGEACLVPEGRNLCLGQRTVLLKVDRTQIAPELVIANLYSKRVQDRFLVEMNGSTVGNLRLPVIRGTALVVPPRQTQQALVAEYVDALAHLSRLTANAKRLIELAQERRAALITAAVTGQLDVSTGTRVYC